MLQVEAPGIHLRLGPMAAQLAYPELLGAPAQSDAYRSPFERAAAQPQASSPEGDAGHLAGASSVPKPPPAGQSLSDKMSYLVAALGSQFQPGSLGLVQVRFGWVDMR